MPATLTADQDAEVTFITGVTAGGIHASQSFWSWNSDNPATYGTTSNAAKWGSGTPGTGGGIVTYSFAAASNWTSTEQMAFAECFALWSAEANISFQQAASGATGQITIERGTDGSAQGGITRLYRGTEGAATIGRATQGDISIDTTKAGFGPIGASFTDYGGYPYMTVLHEIGHTLGLGHSGPYNETVDDSTQQYSALDLRAYSIMSYIEPNATDLKYGHSASFNWGHSQGDNGRFYNGDPTTPMIVDILSAQRLYGAPVNTPLSGGQIFGFNTNITGLIQPFFDFTINTKPVITLFDIGQNNTLDLSGFSSASTVDLNPGAFSSVAGLINDLSIDLNTAINAVIGGVGNDTLVANNFGDRLIGGGGADTLTGGAGIDTFVYQQLSDSTTNAYDTILNFVDGTDVVDLSALVLSDIQIQDLSSTFTTIFFHVAGSSTQGDIAIHNVVSLRDIYFGSQAVVASTYISGTLNEQDGFGSVGQQIWRNYFNGSGVLTEEDGFSNGLKSAASLFDGSGRQFEYDSFDASGHKTSAVQYAADGGQTSIGYNSAGAIIGQYGFAAGGSQTYANLYDAGGRLTEQDGFDSGGHRTLIISRNADASYSATHLNTAGHTTENDFYDTQGRITQVAIYNADASSLTSYFDTSQHLTEQDTANASGQVILTVTATGAGSYAVNSHADTVRLVGTTSADTFTGGGVSQTFVLGTSPGLDTIINFHAGTAAGHDVVEISKSLAGDYAHLLTDAQDVGSDVVITFDAHDTLTLHNLHIANLNSANFTFV